MTRNICHEGPPSYSHLHSRSFKTCPSNSRSFKLRPERTLFASFFSKPSTNSTITASTSFDKEVQQFCGHSGGLRLERHSSLADLGCLAYPEGRAVPFLSQALALGRSRDYGAHSDLRMKDRKRSKAGTEVSEEQVISNIRAR